jgi:hypothetical protein
MPVSQWPRKCVGAEFNYGCAVCGKLAWQSVNHNSDFELSITHYSGVIVTAISSKTMKLVRLRTGFDVHQNQCGNALHTEG